MATCGLTTIALIESYTGTTLDSAETVVYQDIIDAVSLYITQYCGQNFCDDVYSERISITDGEFTLCNNLQYFYGVSYGVEEVISVSAPSTNSSITISKDGDTLTLINGFTSTDIDIAASTLSGTVTLITAEAGWTATLGTGITDNYAKVIFAGSYAVDTNSEVSILGSPTKISTSQASSKVFQVPVTCSEGVAVYQGGYAVVPSDLEDAATRMTIKAYNDRASAVSGDLKKEVIGDYQYEIFSANDNTAGVTGTAIDYYAVLDSYKCADI
jgi:hypothetical protein